MEMSNQIKKKEDNSFIGTNNACILSFSNSFETLLCVLGKPADTEFPPVEDNESVCMFICFYVCPIVNNNCAKPPGFRNSME